MADYEFKYRLPEAPMKTYDGSGIVIHQIVAIARVAGSEDPFFVVRGRHKDFCVPAAELMAALQPPGQANKYKAALAANLHTQPVPLTGWDLASLEALVDANDASAEAAAAANEWILGIAGQYPVDFSL